ncbi:hypothetical protein OPQ81_002871 [Rhizoctonia solani]|nr:hypothetical protein OPQ81_002871 [Rhizoctonia solani]
MSAQHPPDGRDKPGLRQTIRSRVKSVKNAVTGSANSHQPSAQPEHLTPPSLGSRFLSLFNRSNTALINAPPPTESDRQAATPSPRPEPTIQAAALKSEDNTITGHKGSGSIAWSRLASSLHAFESTVESFPPLKSAVAGLVGCLDTIQAAAANRTDCDKLASEFQSLADMLNHYAGELDSDSSNGSIANIAQCIQDQIANIKKNEERGTIGRLLDASHDQEDVIRRYRQVESLFRRLQCDMNMRTKDDVKKQLEITLLRGMLPVDDARYNSGYSMTIKRRSCTAETREAIHQTLKEWTMNPKSEKIYWMNGMAGTGKTTIAYSFCEWLEGTNRLGASFFCSRISSTCRSLVRIVPTLAYQLARYSPAFRSKLCAALKNNPDAGTLNVVQQFEKLINEPMIKAKTAIPDSVVIVVDALDECDDIFSVRQLLDVLLKFAQHLPMKFFVASRPEHVIRDRMMSQGGTARAIVHLHDIEQSIVEGDIKKYLTEAFSSMNPCPSLKQIELLAKRSRNLFIYAATVVRYIYPEDVHVDSTTRLESMLAAIDAPKSVGKNKYEDLDRLYTTVLSAVFNMRLDEGEKDNMQRVLWTVVSAKEPVPVDTIASLACLTERQVWAALQSLRSVVHVPEDNSLISTLHASFPEYMLNQSRAGGFHCDESESNEMLVHRCFDVMKSELKFNICNLKSSYLADKQVDNLESRVTQYISPTLSYSCRYWGNHLFSSPTSTGTRDMLLDFLFNRLLFWMEVLNLSSCIGIGAPMLHRVQTWLREVDNSSDAVQKQVADIRNFVTCQAGFISTTQSAPRGLFNITSQRDDALLAIWNTESEVNSVSMSPEGDRIVAGSVNGSIHVYDMHTGAIVLGPFRGHKKSIRSVAFSADGMHIASGSNDETVIIWDAQTGSIVTGPLHVHTSDVWSIAFSPDGSRVISGSIDGTIIVWDTLTGAVILGPLKSHTGGVLSVAYSPDGRLIASGGGSEDHTVRVWDANTGAAVFMPFEGHKDSVWTVAFSPDGTHLASGSQDQTIRVWNIKTGTPVGLPLEDHTSPIGSIAFSSDGKLLVSGGWGIMVWDMHTRSPILRHLREHPGWIQSVVFSPDDTRVVSSTGDGIRIWDVQTKDRTADQQSSHDTSVGPVAVFPDRTRLISNTSAGVLRIWDIRTGSTTSQVFEQRTEDQSISSLAISPQGTHVAAGAKDFSIRVWNTLTGKTVCHSLNGHQGSVRCLAFSPDSSYLCSSSDDCTIIVWDINAGTMVGPAYGGHQRSVQSVSYSQDGTRIASGSDDASIHVWDPRTGALVHTLEGHSGPVLTVAFLADGSEVISGGGDGSIRRWDVKTGKSCGILFEPPSGSDPGPVNCICILPDDARVIAGFGSMIRVFDSQTTEIVSVLSMPRHEKVQWVGLSPDGNHIISVSVSASQEDNRQPTEETTKELPHYQPPNIIRAWRADAYSDQGNSSDTTHWSYESDGCVMSPEGLVVWVPRDLVSDLKKWSVSYGLSRMVISYFCSANLLLGTGVLATVDVGIYLYLVRYKRRDV